MPENDRRTITWSLVAAGVCVIAFLLLARREVAMAIVFAAIAATTGLSGIPGTRRVSADR